MKCFRADSGVGRVARLGGPRPVFRSSRFMTGAGAFVVALDRALARSCDAECALGNVVRYHRAGARVGVVGDLDRRHERRVDARVDTRPNLGPMLFAPS